MMILPQPASFHIFWLRLLLPKPVFSQLQPALPAGSNMKGSIWTWILLPILEQCWEPPDQLRGSVSRGVSILCRGHLIQWFAEHEMKGSRGGQKTMAGAGGRAGPASLRQVPGYPLVPPMVKLGSACSCQVPAGLPLASWWRSSSVQELGGSWWRRSRHRSLPPAVATPPSRGKDVNIVIVIWSPTQDGGQHWQRWDADAAAAAEQQQR